jgi:predicted nucleic acid-binding protein
MAAPELVDTSVWGRKHLGQVEDWLQARLMADEVGITDIVKLELLHSPRNAKEWDTFRADLDTLPQAPVGPDEWRRALDVMGMLARRGHHKGPGPADFLIAAAAESQGWTLVHYDSHYDLIVDCTGQPARWVADRGSLPQ